MRYRKVNEIISLVQTFGGKIEGWSGPAGMAAAIGVNQRVQKRIGGSDPYFKRGRACVWAWPCRAEGLKREQLKRLMHPRPVEPPTRDQGVYP
jgi:hypothetical protein